METVNQMKQSAKRYFHGLPSGVKKSPMVASATIVRLPPTQMGLETQ